MIETRVSAKTVVQGQIPLFMQEEYPLFGPFLKQYYESEAHFSSPISIVKNIDQLLKVGTYTSEIVNIGFTTVTQPVDFTDTTIYVESTATWPSKYGLLKIDDEIITYTSLGSTFFGGCIRGFSGITTYSFYNKNVSYETTELDTHEVGSKVENLSTIFLQQFFKKLKYQILPGFENFDLSASVNQQNLIRQAKDFYSSKGTSDSNNILFKSLYGETCETIKPQDYLLKPSANDYRLVKQIVVKPVIGDPLKLSGNALFQETESDAGITTNYGSISNVEVINDEYYQLDIDYGYNRDIRTFGTIVGKFTPHPKTKLIGIGNSTLIVDSTLGFPKVGNLIVENAVVAYSDKTTNQFLQCVGIGSFSINSDVVSSSTVTYGFDDNGNRIDVEIVSILEKLNQEVVDFNYFSDGDPVLVKSLGLIKEKSDSRFNSWRFNTSVKYNPKSITFDGQYFVVTTHNDHLLFVNDDLEFIDKNSNSIIFGKVEKIISDTKFKVSSNLDRNQSNLESKYYIRRSLKKYDSDQSYTTDIQNVYDLNEDVFVTSPSIPSYTIFADTRSKSAAVAGVTTAQVLNIENHGFYSGDIVELSFNEKDFSNKIKTYFVKKIDNSSISLALSNSNISNNIFEDFYNQNQNVSVISISPVETSEKILKSQKLVRKIPKNVSGQSINTIPGRRLGILVNGVEILNYKSKESVYYGPIKSIDVLDGGYDYDVINPPVISIEDSTGIGATGNCAVIGSLQEIKIVDGGFDYIDTPTISISGGNGSGAKAEAKITKINHDIYFNASGVATALGGFIDTSLNTIGFNTDHKLNLGEEILYNSFDLLKIGIGSTSGDSSTKDYLQDNSVYYVSIIDDKKIKLHKNFENALSQTDEINLTSVGEGIQRFRSTRKKNIITSINVIDGGSGYENKKRIASPLGINTSNSIISIENHDYKTGEIITYNTTGSVASGLSTSENYYVIKIDENRFRLASAGIGTTFSNFKYLTNQYVNISSIGSGDHEFNYPEISVTISGKIGLSRTDSSKYESKIIPVFRGKLSSIQMTNHGSGYGSTDIINFNKQPIISLKTGKDAVVKPIIKNQKISEIIVLNSGSEYNSLPSFNFEGSGSHAQLTPIIEDGRLVSVKVINGGVGFTTGTDQILVESSGKSSAKLKANIKKWTVNLVEKYKNAFSQDDGIIVSGIRSDLQYVNLFAPRNLRKELPAKNVDGSNNYATSDLIFNNVEILSNNHSPIIGWAYDGNPIYGPYGFETIDGSRIKPMLSGYELISNSDRPNGFSLGFFVEDYAFTNVGDLDEHNGRFCKTPDFPNGTYAYFCTINGNENGFDQTYSNYRRPTFPYVIGNTYKSTPNQFNYLPSSNQNDFDLLSDNYIKNTYPYKLNDDECEYEFIFQPQKITNQLAKIDSTYKGAIDSIGITSAGYDYNVGDIVVFDDRDTSGGGASARVSEIFESRISSLSAISTKVDNVEFSIISNSGIVEGISSIPHGFKNLDIINVSGISSEFFIKFAGNKKINVLENQYISATGIGTTGVTGIVTNISILNTINKDFLQADDILKITNPGVGTEKLLVLSVDPVFNRIRVKREHDGTIGYAYSAFATIQEDPRRFTYESGISTETSTNTKKLIYFNPQESVAIGTVGSGATITYSVGSLSESKFIRLQSIYIEDHQLNTNQKVLYSNEGGDSLVVSSNGINTAPIQNNSLLYVAKYADNLIGLSTTPLGIGSTGGFSGIGTNSGLLYFHSYGSGVYHKFISQDNVLTGNVEKNIGIVTCQNQHNLKVGNTISLDVIPGITTTIVIKYNSANRRLVANPKYFSTSGINTNTSTIQISNHNYETGDKVIYSSTNPANGLQNNKIYYTFKIDDNKIKLTESLYQTTIPNPQYVSIGSSGSDHELSSVNPPIDMINGNTIIFDLSDSTLSDMNGGIKVQSFDFDLYTDLMFTNKFVTTLTSSTFEVTKTGIVGVTNNAKLTLKVTESLPSKLYYKLTPLIGKNYLSKEKSEIIVDEDVNGHNEITYKKSAYNNNYVISGIGSTTFTFNLTSYPEYPLYNSSNSIIKYKTSQIGALGSISKVEVLFGGKAYSTPPGITSIRSGSGYGALLFAQSSQIGKISKSSIQTPGFNYPYDKTLKPIAQLPQRLLVNQLYSINSVGLSSGGKNYSVSPDFIVIDSVTNEVKDEVILKGEVLTNKVSKVEILKNTKTLYGNPKIISINNSNGIGVTNISYNQSTKIVTVSLASGFSTSRDFPFSIGSRILVEGIGISSAGGGYNSSQYGYELFTLTGVTSAIGGSKGVLQYKLDKGIDPGIFSKQTSLQNGSNSYGRIVPESYLPVFNPTIKFGEFTYNKGESIFVNDEKVGTIVSWDPIFNLLKINNSPRQIQPGEILRGGATDNRSTVVFNYKSYGDFSIGSTNEKLKDYSGETGKLNTYSQVLQDGNYYQNFSYSLKSKVPIHKWSNSVDSLTHPLGYKKFSDLQVESEIASPGAGITIASSNTNVLVDLIEKKDFDCYENFAFAKESTKSFDGNLVSSQISFDSLRLLDYTEFVTNRVLSIDDISNQFDDTPSIFNYGVVANFDITQYYAAQFYILIKDARYFGEKEIITVNVIYDGSNGYLTSYAANKTLQELGKFSFRRFGNFGQILFYPTKYEYNSYNFGNCYVSIGNTNVGINTAALGDVVSFASSNVSISASPTPISNTVVSISTSITSSAKVLVAATGDNGEFQLSEVNLTSNGNQCEYVIFGEIDSGTSTPTYGEGSVGSVGVTTSATGMLVTFTPVSNTNVTVNSLSISIGNTSTVGVATTTFYYGELSSHYTAIGSTSSPIATRIAGFSTSGLDKHDGANYYVQITDTTNNQVKFSEITLINDSNNQSHIEEFAVLTSDGILGNIGAESDSANTYLTFTPDPNISVEARVFQKTLQITPKQIFGEIDLSNSILSANINVGGFEGTQLSLRKDFNLTHRGSPIFKKTVDASSSLVVDENNNTVSIPNHFFITGEKIDYSVTAGGSRIGIATTTIAGVGTTTLLPSTIYAVKVSDNLVKFAETPEKALKFNPEVFNITSVGVGTSHFFKSNYKSNSKSLISIDNVIQSPIVATAKTAYLTSNTDDVTTASIFEIDDAAGFYALDLLKIDNEFVLITDIGIGGPNRIVCRRAQFGTEPVIHTTGSILTKYSGNYNIVDDIIYFVSAPHGDTDGAINENTSHFNGRIFLRSQPTGAAVSAYYENNIFDDISEQFDGKKSTFTLKSFGQNISGIVSSNSVSAGILLINNVFQKPKYPATGIGQTFTYEVIQNSGISSVVFSGNSVGLTTNNITGPMKFDVNSAGIPRGGIIVSVGSTQGFGFQPLISAGGTAIVSAAGTIQSISIGNSGSGYRPGIQTSIVVSVATSAGNLSIGTARALDGNIVSIAVTYVGSGYTTTNPPTIIIDSPLNYENIPLIYDSSNTGIGTESAVDIVVGYGNSVLQFNMTNSGYGYTVGDVLTFAIGGATGIPTVSGLSYRPFQITVLETFTDQFNCWYPGQFIVLDDFSDQFDGFKKIFTMKENGVVSNFVAQPGSPIQVDKNLLIFINDTLQIPQESYIFNGGSQIEFLESPKSGDTVKALFYKGSDSDVREVSVLPTIKPGDSLKLTDQLRPTIDTFTQNKRTVTEVSIVDSVYTTQYFGPGITSEGSIIRTVEWCKQKDDFYIDEVLISKSRNELSANIFPVSNLIRPIGVASTSIFIQNARPLFNYSPEILPSGKQNIRILNQIDPRSAIATAIVSVAGTISQIVILDGGVGFSTSPSVVISLGSTGSTSIATCSISGVGTVSSISIINSGVGYTSTNPPQVLISTPTTTYEDITGVNYEGDFGIISGIGTTSISGVSTGITFDFYIPKDSAFRDSTQVGTALTISGIQTGYYFVVYDSIIGNGVTSINDDTSILGIGSTYIDNVYQAFSVQSISGNAVGVGNTTELVRVVASVLSYNNLSGIGNSQFFGYFSWGRLYDFDRGASPKEFSVDLSNGLSGISTSPLVIRSTPMRSLYTS